jgi:thiamine-phosphate pyrophosphorylase
MSILPSERPHPHVLTDPRLSRGRPHLEIVEAALAGGADIVQFRDKMLPPPERKDAARLLLEATRAAGVLFVVNDHLELARELGADGLHLGPEDLALPEARASWPAPALLGASARTPERAREAAGAGADYLGVGPFAVSRTKPGLPSPLGVEGLGRVVHAARIPVVAIGGIDASNAAHAIRAGAAGVAVISAVVGAVDVERATRRLREVIDAAAAEAGPESLAPRRPRC